eukprot:gene10549-11686_t
MRDTYGVQHGTLSSEPNETVIVNVRSFVAGAHYYFREFYDPACINASPQEEKKRLISESESGNGGKVDDDISLMIVDESSSDKVFSYSSKNLDGDTLSIMSAELVNIREAEIRVQMLEDVTADNLRVLHGNTPIDCPLIGENAVIINSSRKRKKVVVLLIFRDEEYCSRLSKSLRKGGAYGAIQIDTRTYQMELFFEDPEKAKVYLEWKEKKTLEAWKDVIV